MPDEREICSCQHEEGWHIFSDGPHPRICNYPKCKCIELVRV